MTRFLKSFLLTATVIGRLKIRCRGSSSLGGAAGYGGGASTAGWSGGAAASSSPGGGAREPKARRKPTSTASPATVTPQTSTQLHLQPAGTDLLLLTHCRTGNSHTCYLTTDESCENYYVFFIQKSNEEKNNCFALRNWSFYTNYLFNIKVLLY